MTKQQWNSDDIPQQTEKVAMVTGSNTGIGYEAVRVLANKKAHVIIAVRNVTKGELAAEKIRQLDSSADISVMALDLADLCSVCAFAQAFADRHSRLDLLINNAGVMLPPYSQTKDGFEIQFGTNHLGHFALAGQLIELLKKTKGSRIVNVSSVAHRIGNVNFDDLNWQTRKYRSSKAYCDSKIANMYFTHELARKRADAGDDLRVVAAHPGWTKTDLQRHCGLFSFFNPFLAQTVSMGALPTLYGAIEPRVKSGCFIGPSGFAEIRGYPKEVAASARATNQEIASKLWRVSEQCTGIGY